MQYLKAIVGAATAGLGALGTALIDSSVAPVEWVGVAGAVLSTFTLVWGVPNRPAAS